MARKKHYNYYDDNFKATAIGLADLAGVYATDVAEALDIHPIMLYRWRKELKDGKIMAKKKNIQLDPKTATDLKRLRKVEKEYKILQEEHALLKKAIRFSSARKKKSSNS
jgi:transposase-like protein